jgi:TRAP-type C4-dicarboxylate transport system substrate-binding protein
MPDNCYVINKEACRESFDKFPPDQQELIKEMATEFERLMENEANKDA